MISCLFFDGELLIGGDVNPAKLSHDVKPKMHKAHACLPWQGSTHVHPMIIIHTIWLFNIAMEHHHF